MTDIDFQAAKNLALKKLESRARSLGHSLSINDASTRTFEFGWVFFYNTTRFLETGDIGWALGGNAPIFVSSEGELHELGTGKPWEERLSAIRAKGLM